MQVECKTEHIPVAPWNISNSDQEPHLESNNRKMSSIQKRYVDDSKFTASVVNANMQGDIYFSGESGIGATRLIQNVSNRSLYQYPLEPRKTSISEIAPAYRYLKSQTSNDNLNVDSKLPTTTSKYTYSDNARKYENHRDHQSYEFSYGSFPETTKDYYDPIADDSNDVPGAAFSDSSTSSYSPNYDGKTNAYNVEESVINGSKFYENRDGYKSDLYASDRMKKYDSLKSSSSGLNVGALASYETRFKNKNGSEKANGIGAVRCKMIEISPGEYMRLRGAQETWKAIQDDFYIPCSCICCELTLFCIQDATYVLCPVCQVVSSLEQIDGYDGGVGLGFTMDELAQWQNEILQERQY